ncbi:MAG: hypothetical protein L0211_19365 [Planctomycetaceae bacterium]|nr:hypothetical protein [Planctomycetaceae bacterium]
MPPRFGHILTWLGWLLAVVSLLLPVSRAVELAGAPIGTPLVGWQALTVIVEQLFNVWFWLAMMADPAAQWLPILAGATLLLVVLPPFLLAVEDKAGCLQIPLGIVPVVLGLLPPHLQTSLCWGVWVWSAAFLLVSLGGVLRGLAAGSDKLDTV